MNWREGRLFYGNHIKIDGRIYRIDKDDSLWGFRFVEICTSPEIDEEFDKLIKEL